MKILSIHLGHDSSICLFNNGNIEKYFLVERFTGIKHDFNFFKILKFISSDIKEKIDLICLSTFCDLDENIILKITEEFKYNNSNIKVHIKSNHHLNHAFLSFSNSKFDESIVVVVDGSGSIVGKKLVEVESIFKFTKLEQKLIYKNVVEKFNILTLPWNRELNNIHTVYDYKNIFSIGSLYDIAAILIGNTPDDCGKAMGLSSYGSNNHRFKNIFIKDNTLNNNFYRESSEETKFFLKNPIKEITKNNYKLYADFCHEVQIQTQNAVGNLIENAIEKTGIKKVCISGGYGMNIISNYYYLQRFPDVEFYFEPLCNDSGVSIGSAMSLYFDIEKKYPTPLKNTLFHGIKYNISSYKGLHKNIKDIASFLYQNKSIAVYTGLAEAGQRALGNRSIFFNALNPNAKNLVNKIKKREWYRPFACIVLEEEANMYFDMNRIKSSPFMTVCFPVRPKYSKILSGVIHIDNTCRIQTVKKTDGYLYDLLLEFKKLSGHAILLNTSFNLAGKPLVETPEDAFNTLNNSLLDYLWFEETKQLFNKKINYV